MYKVLFLDIDGTILKPDYSYDSSTKEAIAKAKANGVEVFLATGKPFYEIKSLATELNITSFISFNGAYATMNGKELFKRPFKKELVEHYLRLANENGHEIGLYTDHRSEYTDLYASSVQKFTKALHMTENAQLNPNDIPPALGVTLMGVNTEEELEPYLIDPSVRLSQVNVYGTEDCYDLIRQDVNKGIGVEHVLKELGLNKDQAIAFGDGMNDKEMLQAVGHSFAMANANPELFQYAKYKTTSVEDSGIAKGLEKLGVI
ncbi:HAD family hydrolase [Aciduricibacillus chroicocephali]|uniref:HAD family hydrolase n=1 Tax=Aciduricibacillus chroicocephali TaxID=3054939 RepID=A0ABY9KU72_9BACI|nr:HAD family hydrolase [Bacillaceae bacterium 44XB]